LLCEPALEDLVQPFNGLGMFQLLTTNLCVQCSTVQYQSNGEVKITQLLENLEGISLTEEWIKGGRTRNSTTRLDLLAEGIKNMYMFLFKTWLAIDLMSLKGLL
jgi:hypothetical protein